ncbi:MAG: phosphate ABC transporter substrate-binding protein PstS [Xenococcaceae cyanobacterium]
MHIDLINSPHRLVTSLSVLALTASLAACGGGQTDTDLPLGGNVRLTGAGASFPAPLYQNWFVQFNQKVPAIQVNYQSIGSGAGVEQFTAKTVDFGASDVAMTDDEIAKVDRGVLLLPMTAGSIVLAYNLPEVESGLKLTQEAYVGIFMGKITKWNDPKIAKANPNVKLPDKPITVVHRSDGSGTTGVFTKHLGAINKDWQKTIGAGKSVPWPTTKGKFIGGKGNEGVTAQILQNEGSIGYVEYGYAKNNNLNTAALQNKAGNFIEPTDESASKTLASVKLPENLRAFITDPEGDDSYPIVTYSWMLIYKKYDDSNKAVAMEKMIEFGLTTGQQQSSKLGYIPLPENIIEKVAAAADQISSDYEIKVN